MLTRWTPGLALFMVASAGLLWVIPLVEVLRGDHGRSEQIALCTGSAVLAIPFVWICWRMPKVMRGIGIEIDGAGVHPFDGRRTDTIAWHEIAAVGFGSYLSSHRGGTTRRLCALEVYLVDEAYTGDHPRLRGDWQVVAPPAPGLSAGCYRFTVPPAGPAAARVERAVHRFRPRVWQGPFTHRAGQRGIG